MSYKASKKLEQVHWSFVCSEKVPWNLSKLSKDYLEELEYCDRYLLKADHCELDGLLFCESGPVYPYYILGWDELRNYGLPSEHRMRQENMVWLCAQCTLLLLSLKKKWWKSAYSKVVGTWPEIMKLRDRLYIQATNRLEPQHNKSKAYVDSLQDKVVTIEGALDFNFGDLGRLVRVDTTRYQHKGIITLTLYRE